MNTRHDDQPLIALLTVGMLALATTSLLLGEVSLPLGTAIDDLWHGRSTAMTLILVDLRLPRALLGILVGSSLGLAGAAMQGLLRNPLAEPGVMGVSGFAAVGAVAMFYSGLAATYALALPIGGIAGALLAVVALYGLAGRNSSILSLLLAGTAMNSLSGALTALALNLSPNPYASFEILFWLMGSLADRSFEHIALAGPPILIGWLLLGSSGRALDALTLGEETARSLGFNLARIRLMLVCGAALAVGSAVAVTGVIGFVGLVVPHLIRPLVGNQPSRVLLPSALGGACLVLAADIAVRTMRDGPELKLGVLTALVGAPFFLALLRRMRREAI